ncbi:MAG: helix-turn-helix transcriptional regulator [Eubacteriales bacterium]|nr:helix-turn-helix transcriptional regulator [Eubacteriales bacterium]
MEAIQKKTDAATTDIPHLFRRYNIDRINGEGNYELYCQEFGYSVIYGNLQYGNLDQILKLLRLESLPDYMLLVRVDEYIDIFQHFPDFNNYSIKGTIMHHLEETLNAMEIRHVLANYKGTDTLGVFLCMKQRWDISEENMNQKLGELAEKMIENVRRKTNTMISITISGFCNSLMRFPYCYEECKNAFPYLFTKGSGSYTFCHTQPKPEQHFEKQKFQEYTAGLLASVENGSWTEVENEIEAMTAYLARTCQDPHQVKLHVSGLIHRLRESYEIHDEESYQLDSLFYESFEKVLRCSFLEDIRRILGKLLEEIRRQQEKMKMSADERLRFQIERFISQYYAQPEFGIGMLAELNHYNPEHFGQVFRRLYQVSFSQYLAGYRIEKAKSLLKNENLSLNEIAERVGFSSTSYFCTVFKNRTGLSPKQFLLEKKE